MKGAFYLPPDQWGEPLRLSGEEFHHAQVLRVKPGDKITLLDGRGKTAICSVLGIGKKEMLLSAEDITRTPAPASFPIIALALSKAVRRGFFMEKASELGAGAIWVWEAERSQGKLAQSLFRNLEGQLVAGMKQSLNPWLPELALFDSIQEVIQASTECQWKYLPYEAEEPSHMLNREMLGKPGKTLYIIGPEGGICEAELEALDGAGFRRASLGPRVLRCETAATLCLGLHYWASQFPPEDGAQ